MTFTIDEARAIVKHYQFLIGQDLDQKLTIHYILIAPSDFEQFKVFMQAFNITPDNQTALISSGIDTSKVKVLLVHHDTWGGNIMHSDLDMYLTRTKGEKVYANPDFLKGLNQ